MKIVNASNKLEQRRNYFRREGITFLYICVGQKQIEERRMIKVVD